MFSGCLCFVMLSYGCKRDGGEKTREEREWEERDGKSEEWERWRVWGEGREKALLCQRVPLGGIM